MNNRKQLIVIGAIVVCVVLLVFGINFYLEYDEQHSNQQNYHDQVADTVDIQPSQTEVQPEDTIVIGTEEAEPSEAGHEEDEPAEDAAEEAGAEDNASASEQTPSEPVQQVTSEPATEEPVTNIPVTLPEETAVIPEPEPVIEIPAVPTPVYTFRNQRLLNEHYEKHGIEMGFPSAEAYQAAASAVITNPNSLFKIEAEDGDGVYYLEATNEFVILSTDGYIRTYFLPSSGKAYFDRQ